MSRNTNLVFVAVAAAFVAAGVIFWALDGASVRTVASAQDQAGKTPVWIGARMIVPNEDENEYLIGTVDKYVLDAIELGEYDRRFVRI